MDTIFINGVMILTTINKAIKFRASAYVMEISHAKYYKALDLVLCR